MRSCTLLAALALAAAGGCKKEEAPAAKAPPSAKSAETAPAAAAEPEADAHGPLPWIQDDYPAAFARAKAAGKPLVIDLWAAWCHTCLSMQQTVLADPSLEDLADRFVWVAIDTEKPKNAPVLADLPVHVWPTFYVVSPVDGSIQARQLGATGIAGFRELLLQGERGHLEARGAAGELADDPKLEHLRTADRLAAAGQYARAAASYAEALKAAPADWSRQSDVLVLQIAALAKAEDYPACAALGKERLGDAVRARNAAAADFVYWASLCGRELSDFDMAGFRARASEALEAVLADAAAPLSFDDRSEALRILRSMASHAGDDKAARALAERQRAVLDQAVAAASSPFEEMTYGYHRADVYSVLGRGAEMVPWLERLTRELPQQYDPPYRLAGLLAKLERYDEAAKAAELAAERAPDGPRKPGILALLARVQKQRGDAAAELAARQAVVDAYAALPASQKRPEAEAEAREALEAVRAR